MQTMIEKVRASQLVSISELVVGDIVYIHGAEFKVETARVVEYEGRPVYVRSCAWMSGKEVPPYFSATKNWIIQGNETVTCPVDPRN